MSEITQVVEALEIKTQKLVEKLTLLKQENNDLSNEIALLREEKDSFIEKDNELRQELASLKIASSMLGSEEYKKETKLKINAIIREIDACITQLSV